MLQIVMRLEKCITSKEFYKDTANTPDVARIAPSEVKDDFRSAVMSRGNDSRMVFVIESGRPKINQTYVAVQKNLPLASNARR